MPPILFLVNLSLILGSLNVFFLGFHSHVKGYRRYNIQSHKIFVSQDVQFVEHIFPFSVIPSLSHTILNKFVLPYINDLITYYNIVQQSLQHQGNVDSLISADSNYYGNTSISLS